MLRDRHVYRYSLILLAVMILFGGCVSKSDYLISKQENALLREQNQHFKEELASAKKRFDDLYAKKVVLEEKLSTKEMQNISELEGKIQNCQTRINDQKEACDKLVAEASKKGYYQGAADFNSSLKVAGRPTSRGWWIFSSYYYEFQVVLDDERLFSFMIETESEQPPLEQGLALVSELNKWRRLKG